MGDPVRRLCDLPERQGLTVTRTRPLPTRYHDDIEHLDGAARGELRLPRCRSCGREFWPAGPVCPFDFSDDVEWMTDPGEGTVTSWVKFHKQYYSGDDVPYVVVQVELDTGPRLTTSWDCPRDPRVGERARVSFLQLDDGVALPQFGPASPEPT